MENLEPIVSITGDSAVCGKYVPWAKNKAKYLQSTGVSIQTVSFPLVDSNKDKKRVNVLITIKINNPFCHIYITTANIAKKTTLTSGLSRTEIHRPNFNGGDNFIYFYPQPSSVEDTGTTFRSESSLYKSTQIKSVYNAEATNFTYDLPYQKTKLGFNVSQQHYLFGSQFTGEMKQIFQLMLATNVEIGYRPFFLNTDGIYTDSKGNKHLINISPNGIYTKSLTYSSYSSSIINVSIPDGIAIDYTKDSKLLEFDIYNGVFTLDPYQGWAFNSDGSNIQNVFCYTNNLGYLETYRYGINISDSNGILSANIVLLERERLYMLQQDRLMGGLSSNNNNLYMPENLSNYKYNSSKKGTLSNIPLTFFATQSDINNLPLNTDFKAPLSVYYNDKDEVQVVYYNVKKVAKTMTKNTTNPNINNISDFFHPDTYNENDFTGWVKEYGTLEILNDNIDLGTENLFNTEIHHGFMINNNESTLFEDNGGDISTTYNIFNNSLEINNDDTLSYSISQGFENLSAYNDFYLVTYASNSQNIIKDLNYKINTYKDNFIKTLQNQVTTYFIDGFSSFKLDLQAQNINYFLSDIDNNESLKLSRLNSVIPLKNIDNIEFLNIKDIDYSPFLYKINSNIKEYFDYFIDNKSNFETALGNIGIILDNINNSYSVNTRNQFSNLLNYLKSFDDSSNLDYNNLNEQIANLNNNIIPLINNYHDNINSAIDTINGYFTTDNVVKNFIFKVNQYSGFVNSYNSLYINSISNDFGLKLLNSWDIDTKIEGNIETKTTYYAFQQLNRVNRSVKQIIKNRKVNYSTLVFNNYNRSSFAIFNQEDNLPNLNYYNIVASSTNPINALKNFNAHSDICETNTLRFFKQDNLYDNSTYTTTYVDIEPIDEIGYNKISKVVTDRNGNNIPIDAVAFSDNTTFSYKLINSNGVNNTSKYYNYLPGNLNNTFTNESVKTTYRYDIKNVNYSDNVIEYNATIEKTFKVYGLENILNVDTTNIIDYDKRFITDVSSATKLKNKNFTTKDIINDYSNDGVTYFLCSKDAFSKAYVINKGFYGYLDTQFFLTNITSYHNIFYNSNNVYSVNYLGMPFFGKNDGV